MKNEGYLNALRKALAPLNKQNREEIVQEIQSHLDAAGSQAGDEFLVKQFGTPETLAQQYLDGEPLKTSVTQTAKRFGKRVLMLVGAAVIALILLIMALMWWITRDAFDYSDESLLDTQSWLSIVPEQAVSFQLEQSKAVFYWHHQDTLKWSCKGGEQLNPDNTGLIELTQEDCLIILPKQPVHIVARQANPIFIRPQAHVDLQLSQSRLRIAQDASYQYQIGLQSSRVSDLKHQADAAIQIKIEGQQSRVSSY